MEHVTDNRKNIHKETQAILLDNYMEMRQETVSGEFTLYCSFLRYC